MPLPSVPTPRFDLTLPSSGNRLSYRPFLVGEQKLILSALETKDPDQLNNAIEDVVKNCTFDKFDVQNAPVYDVEYVLLNIHAVSSGQIIDMVYTCKNQVNSGVCAARVNVKVNTSQAQVVKPAEHENKLMMTNDIGLVMRDIPYGIWRDVSKSGISTVTIDVMAACIQSVFTEEQVHTRGKDFDDKDAKVFIEQLGTSQFEKLEKFFETMPYLGLTLQIRCPRCGSESTIELKGLDDFLG